MAAPCHPIYNPLIAACPVCRMGKPFADDGHIPFVEVIEMSGVGFTRRAAVKSAAWYLPCWHRHLRLTPGKRFAI